MMILLTAITAETPVGEFHLLADDQGVVRASGFGPLRELAGRLPGILQGAPLRFAQGHPYHDLVGRYFDGDEDALKPIPRAQDGSDFQQDVWQAMSRIGAGQTLSYKQLAAAAGHPEAIRAAGTVCGQNRLILLVPCHRVVKSGGGIGNYVYGPAIKEYLLQHEASR